MYTLYAFAYPPDNPTLRLFGLQVPQDSQPTFFGISEEHPSFGPRAHVHLALSRWQDHFTFLRAFSRGLSSLAWNHLPPEQAPRTHWVNNFFLPREKELPPGERPSTLGQWYSLQLTEDQFLIAINAARRASSRPLRNRLIIACALAFAAVTAMYYLC